MTTEQKTTKRTKKVVPTCQICVEPFNKSNRLPVQCPYCQYECCRSCVETYVLNETTVKCMNPECAKEWARKHIRAIFTLVFINGPLREHTEKVLFDKERALLPATQPIIEGKIEARKIQGQMDQVTEQMTELYHQISTLRREHSRMLTEKNNVLHRRPREARAFVRACPEEECRGFLSSQWKCGICEKWTCPDCHIVKGYARDTPHECKEDDLATARLLAADTKPCPKCAAGIFKIDGCDQMWCTQCHTAFSWRTGNIERTIHNPHYYEWMRRTGGGEMPRNPLDVPCGRNLDHYLYESMARILRSSYVGASNSRPLISRIDKLIRYTIHMMEVERPRPPNYERRNEDLRVRYLMNELSEEDMRDQLQKDDKRHHKNQELADIYTLLGTTVTDILFRFSHQLDRDKNTRPDKIDDSILDEIYLIVDYANECLADVAYTYSSPKIVIDNDMRILRGTKALEYIRVKKESIEIAAAALTNAFV
jgi:hypothetical protein